MKLLLDADVPRSFLKPLKDENHNVIDVRDSPSHPLKDEEIFKIAQREGRILITRDLDFSNILNYPPHTSSGIIVLRTHLLSKWEIFKILQEVLKRGQEELNKTLVIATRHRLRFYR